MAYGRLGANAGNVFYTALPGVLFRLWVERPGPVDVVYPDTHEKLFRSFNGISRIAHTSPNYVLKVDSILGEGFAGPSLKRARPQYLSNR
jgi:hypothetical protein